MRQRNYFVWDARGRLVAVEKDPRGMASKSNQRRAGVQERDLQESEPSHVAANDRI